MADIKKIIEDVKAMTVVELNDLVKAIEEEFGVSAAAMAVAAPVAGAGAPAEEEKTEFNVVLESAGPNSVQAIKVIREITGLGLMECKALIANPNAVIKEAIAKEAAEEMVKKFEAVGAKAVLK